MRSVRLLCGLAVALAVVLMLSGCGGVGSGPGDARNASADVNGGADSVRRIVVFQEDYVNLAAQEALVRRFGEPLNELKLINGMTVFLPTKSVAGLAREPGVLRIDVDAEVHALAPPEGKGKPAPPSPAQGLPWGVDRIDAEYAWPAGYTGSLVNVAVIDTGIDKDHPDLDDNISGGVNFVRLVRRVDPTKWDDDNGHGTHVAGIVAAEDNDIGVVGVAPKASLYGVKVLDRNGSGYVSDVILGIEWCVGKVQIANMSLGTTSDIESLHVACDNAKAAGLLLVAAAGNSGGSVIYPAKYDSVIAVAAVDRTDTRPSWSSYGPQILVAAPGVSVYSTWKGGGYATVSGTSMAAPHVAGTLALNLGANLAATADDLLPLGFDVWTGWGLVDAEEAATGSATTGNDLPGTVS